MHWFIVVNQKEAKIYVKTLEQDQLKLLKSLINPLGGEKKRALIRKEAGRGVKSVGHLGSIYYSEPKRHDPHEEAIKQFAKELAHFLKEEKLKNNFESLSIIAEPHLLGKIRAEMGDGIKKSVTQWIKKDLQKVPVNKLVEFLIPKKMNSMGPSSL